MQLKVEPMPCILLSETRFKTGQKMERQVKNVQCFLSIDGDKDPCSLEKHNEPNSLLSPALPLGCLVVGYKIWQLYLKIAFSY